MKQVRHNVDPNQQPRISRSRFEERSYSLNLELLFHHAVSGAQQNQSQSWRCCDIRVVDIFRELIIVFEYLTLPAFNVLKTTGLQLKAPNVMCEQLIVFNCQMHLFGQAFASPSTFAFVYSESRDGRMVRTFLILS